MKIASLCLLPCLLSITASSDELSFTSDFGAPGVKIPRVAQGKIEGELPQGWSEDSSGWCKVDVACSKMSEDGARFSRFDVKSLNGGVMQFHRLIEPVSENTFFKLEVKGRALSARMKAGIRQRGAPYAFLKTLAFREESDKWEELSTEFMLKKGDAPVGVWINFDGEGVGDVASVKLERVKASQLAERVKAKNPDGAPANLLRNPILPCGLQEGWLIKSSVSNESQAVASDPSVVGPSGSPSLKLSSTGGAEGAAIVASEAFNPEYFIERQAFSVRCKGNGTLVLAATEDGRRLVAKGFGRPGDDWKVFSLPFDATPLSKLCRAEIRCESGSVWIDAMEVCPLSKAGRFSLGGSCVAAFSLPPSDASRAGVQFEDEAAKVDFKVCGDSAGALLSLSFFDSYGTAPVASWELPLGSSQDSLKSGVIDLAPLIKSRNRPYGGFRLEGRVIRNGGPVSQPNEIVLYRLRRPSGWGKDLPESPFGAHVPATERHVAMAKAAGINWTRLHDAEMSSVGWYYLEAQKGQWTFDDRRVDRLRAGKLSILGQFGTAPKWASFASKAEGNPGWWRQHFQPLPERLPDFESYVKAVAARYKGRINDWEVWNEPWVPSFWPVSYDPAKNTFATSENPQKDYSLLSEIAGEALREVNPDAVLLGLNTCAHANAFDSGTMTGEAWTRGVMETGGYEIADVLCYHDYKKSSMPGDKEDSKAKSVRIAFGPVIDRYGSVPKEIWMTEGSPSGAPGSVGFGLRRISNPLRGEDDFLLASDNLAKFVIGLLSSGVAKCFLYTMHKYGGPIDEGYFVIVTPDGSLHPSGAAHAALAFFLEGKKHVKSERLGESVMANAFVKDGRAVVALSGRRIGPERELSLPAGVEAFDLFGNPSGRVFAFNGATSYLAFSTRDASLDSVLASVSAQLR